MSTCTGRRGQANPWGVPDWRDANAYPKPPDLTTREWWWQFTRRRPDYRDMWTKKLPAIDVPSEAKRRELADIAFGNEDLEQWFIRAPFSEEDELRLGFAMNDMIPPTADLPDRVLKLTIFTTTHWATPHDNALLRLARSLTPSGLDAEIERYTALDRNRAAAGLIAFTFDLSRPIEPQLSQAKETLLDEQSKRGPRVIRKPQREHWPTYLRVLDARDSGVTYREIAEVIWPEKFENGESEKTHKNAQELYARACDVRDMFPL
jgi:hypothetical protein